MIETLELAEDLESLQVGTLDAAQFRRKYSGDPSSTIEAVWPNLEHYLADADIRARDAAYRDMQDADSGNSFSCSGSRPQLRRLGTSLFFEAPSRRLPNKRLQPAASAVSSQ